MVPGVVLLVLVGTLVPVSAAAIDAGPPSTTASHSPTPEPSLANATVESNVGDLVRLVVAVRNGSTAVVSIAPAGDATGGYAAEVVVRDADADGRVVLRFNTYVAGRGDGQTFGAAGADEATVADRSGDGEIGYGRFRVTVAPGRGEEPTDHSTLVLRGRTVREPTVWSTGTDPPGNLTTVEDILAAQRTNHLYRDDELRRRTVVLELAVRGISGAFASQAGPNDTARFFALLERTDLALDATVNTSDAAGNDTVALALGTYRSTTVVADPVNDSYYLVVDLGAVRRADGGSAPTLTPGDELAFTVGLEGVSSPNGSTRTSRTTEVVFGDWWAELDGARPLEVHSAPAQTLGGVTNLPPGRELFVVVRTTGTGSFTAIEPVTVRDGGRFAATVDLGHVPDGTQLEVQVRYDDRSLLEDPVVGVVGARPPTSVTLENQTLDPTEQTVTVRSVHVPFGGFVTVRIGSVMGPVVGLSGYLPAGRHANVTVPLGESVADGQTVVAVPHRDTDDDRSFEYVIRPRDGPYVENRSIVGDSATVAVATMTPTGTDTETPSPTATGTPPGSETPAVRTTLPGTAETAPGGGAVLAVLALVCSLVLLRARR